jgi:5-methylcytosine-specific restriction endonuclease McrA
MLPMGMRSRIPIPSDLRRTVFERDGGRCVECGSNFDLQYDHVLPVALGGATTLENLQLLCADCNRRKSDSL